MLRGCGQTTVISLTEEKKTTVLKRDFFMVFAFQEA
jgi:hypothetical protein